jgi:hypothetical protein
MFSTIYVWRNGVIEKNRAGRLSEQQSFVSEKISCSFKFSPGGIQTIKCDFWGLDYYPYYNVAEERYQEAELICLAAVEHMQKTVARGCSALQKVVTGTREGLLSN